MGPMYSMYGLRTFSRETKHTCSVTKECSKRLLAISELLLLLSDSDTDDLPTVAQHVQLLDGSLASQDSLPPAAQLLGC